MRNKYSNLKKVSHKSGEAQTPATNFRLPSYHPYYLPYRAEMIGGMHDNPHSAAQTAVIVPVGNTI